MRSSDPIEGPVFLGLKRIIIIISWPGTGCELYYERRRKSLVFQALREISKAASKAVEGARFEKLHKQSPVSLLHFLLFVVCLILRLNFMWFACQVHLKLRDESQSVTCDLTVHAWQKPVPRLWSGWGTHRFYHGYSKPHVRFSQMLFFHRLTAPYVITPFIYMNIHCVKKGR